jgi:hypothetical protein
MTRVAAAHKYLVTLWKDLFDYDGLTNDFAIMGEFDCLEDAKAQLKPLAEQLMAKELAENPGWTSMDISGKANPPWSKVNNNRRVLACEAFKVGDGTGFNSTYVYLEVIEIPRDEPLSEGLFNLKDCGYEVRSYFHGQRDLGKV